MAESKSALAVVKDFPAPVLSAEVQQEMNGLSIDFDRVRIPAGGGLAFEVPDADGEPESVKEIVGVVVDHHPARTYWRDAFSGQGKPPDCASVNGETGTAAAEAELEWAGASRACADCPMNAWGSDGKGRGKACKELHRLYLLRQGDAFPLLLTLPPTSLRNLSGYLGKRVLAQGLRSYQVLTKVALKRVTNAGGIAYSQAVFALAGRLDPDSAASMAAYAKSIQQVTRQLPAEAADYETTAEEVAEEAL